MTTSSRHRRRPGATSPHDAGFTLLETLVVVMMMALIVGVISAAVLVILRSESSVTTAVGENHDLQQAVNYFHLDVESGPAHVAQWQTSTGTGCDDAGSANLFRYDTDDVLRYDDESGRRIAYRLVDDGVTASIDRYSCTLDTSGNWVQERVLNIADRLPSTASVTVAIASTGGLVDDVTMSFAQSLGQRDVTATPRPESDLAVVPEECGPDPFQGSLGFQNFASGNVTLNSGELEGSLAVGGILAWDDGPVGGFQIPVASSNTNSTSGFSNMALYAQMIDWTATSGTAGRLTTQGGSSKNLVLGPNTAAITPDWFFIEGGPGNPQVNPDLVYLDAAAAAAPTTNDSIATLGPVLSLGSGQQPVIDFAIQLDVLQDCSDALAALPNGAVAEHVRATAPDGSPFTNGTLEITFQDDPLGDQATAVLNIPESVLAGITSVQRAGGSSLNANRPLIVNIIEDSTDLDDDISFDFSTADWSAVGDEKFVIFNFPNAVGTITVVQDSFGAILAPYASQVITNGNLRAQVATTNWTHNGSLVESGNEHRFNGAITWL